MSPYNKQNVMFTVKQIIAACGIILGAKLLAHNCYEIGCVETLNNLSKEEAEEDSENSDEDS